MRTQQIDLAEDDHKKHKAILMIET